MLDIQESAASLSIEIKDRGITGKVDAGGNCLYVYLKKGDASIIPDRWDGLNVYIIREFFQNNV